MEKTTTAFLKEKLKEAREGARLRWSPNGNHLSGYSLYRKQAIILQSILTMEGEYAVKDLGVVNGG